MRESLARTDNDFVLSEPRRKSRKRASVLSVLLMPKLAILVAAKRANLVIGLVFAGLLTAVFINALVWQKSPHPAPLFAHTVPAETNIGQNDSDEKSEVVPMPVSRPAAPSAPAVTPTAEKAVTTPHGRDPMAEVAELPAQKPVPARDLIAQLLKSPASSTPKSTEQKSSEPKPSELKPLESSTSVLAAQRALMKLGYVVKPDGAAGPAFRQALEQFDRDRGLPVSGTLSPKAMHELSARSGISIK